MICLGFDTSNYTTSVAVFNSDDGSFCSERQLLPVPEGALGLRQSDAVFHHTVRLPELTKRLYQSFEQKPSVIAVSVCPSEEAGSYMPCFLVGKAAAQTMSAAFGLPLYSFSHQAGHIAAVLYSAGRTDLLHRPFYAFHLSGGTTDALLVEPDNERLFRVSKIGGSLDLKAGQAIDRVGKMLGLPFPAGRALDELSRSSLQSFHCKPYFRGFACSFSGLQNQCKKMLDSGAHAEDIAKYCMTYICAAIGELTDRLIEKDPSLPIVFSGGVTSNTMMREAFAEKYAAVFAEHGLSSDNAVGVAWLGAQMALRSSG